MFAGLDDGVELFAGKVGAGGDEDVDLVVAEGVAETVGGAEGGQAGGGGFGGEGDDAGEGVGGSGLGGEVGDEGAGFVVPAEDGDALAETLDETRAGEDAVGGAAPGEHEREDEQVGEDYEPAGDGRIEFEDEGEAEVGDEPERGALDDEVEGLEFPEEEAFLVEVELGVGGDEEGGADEEKRQVGAVSGVGDIETDAADGGFIAQPVAEGETGEGHDGVTRDEEGREEDFAQAGGFGHEREFGVVVTGWPQKGAKSAKTNRLRGAVVEELQEGAAVEPAEAGDDGAQFGREGDARLDVEVRGGDALGMPHEDAVTGAEATVGVADGRGCVEGSPGIGAASAGELCRDGLDTREEGVERRLAPGGGPGGGGVEQPFGGEGADGAVGIVGLDTGESEAEVDAAPLGGEAGGGEEVGGGGFGGGAEEEPAEVVAGVFEVGVGLEGAFQEGGGGARGRAAGVGERVSDGELGGEQVGVVGIAGSEFGGAAEGGGVAGLVVDGGVVEGVGVGAAGGEVARGRDGGGDEQSEPADGKQQAGRVTYWVTLCMGGGDGPGGEVGGGEGGEGDGGGGDGGGGGVKGGEI